MDIWADINFGKIENDDKGGQKCHIDVFQTVRLTTTAKNTKLPSLKKEFLRMVGKAYNRCSEHLKWQQKGEEN